MIVAGLQLDIAWEDPNENFRRAEALASQAVAAGADLLVLPEMFATGFSMQPAVTVPAAEPSRRYLADLARRHGVWVVGGHAEAGEPRPYNSLTMFDRQGEAVLAYRKIHPFSLAGEHERYAGGEEVSTVTVEGVRVTPVICYDLRFPEIFRPFATRTDLFLVLANWPAKRGHVWRTLLLARSLENQAYVLGVNRVGVAQGHQHRGDSTLVDPNGVVTSSAAVKEGLVLGTVDTAEVAGCRERNAFLADRRPEVYRRLAEQEPVPAGSTRQQRV